MGFDPETLAAGLPGTDVPDTVARLEVGSARRLYHRLDRQTDDPLLGYRLSQYLDEGATGFLSPLLWHSPTLGVVLDNIVLYQWVLSENGGFIRRHETEKTSGEAICLFEYIPVENAVTANRHQILMLTCTTIQTVRRLMRRQCDIAWLNLPASLNRAEIGKALKCVCRPAERHLSIAFKAYDLDRPVPGRDAALYETVRHYAAEVTRDFTRRMDLVTRIKQAIRTQGYVRAAIGGIERELGLHRRSIQRVLQDGDTSFRMIKQEVLRDEAIRHLSGKRCSIADTAAALGYSETSAFHRAFVLWFEQTPAEFLSSETYLPERQR